MSATSPLLTSPRFRSTVSARTTWAVRTAAAVVADAMAVAETATVAAVARAETVDLVTVAVPQWEATKVVAHPWVTTCKMAAIVAEDDEVAVVVATEAPTTTRTSSKTEATTLVATVTAVDKPKLVAMTVVSTPEVKASASAEEVQVVLRVADPMMEVAREVTKTTGDREEVMEVSVEVEWVADAVVVDVVDIKTTVETRAAWVVAQDTETDLSDHLPVC